MRTCSTSDKLLAILVALAATATVLVVLGHASPAHAQTVQAEPEPGTPSRRVPFPGPPQDPQRPRFTLPGHDVLRTSGDPLPPDTSFGMFARTGLLYADHVDGEPTLAVYAAYEVAPGYKVGLGYDLFESFAMPGPAQNGEVQHFSLGAVRAGGWYHHVTDASIFIDGGFTIGRASSTFTMTAVDGLSSLRGGATELGPEVMFGYTGTSGYLGISFATRVSFGTIHLATELGPGMDISGDRVALELGLVGGFYL